MIRSCIIQLIRQSLETANETSTLDSELDLVLLLDHAHKYGFFSAGEHLQKHVENIIEIVQSEKQSPFYYNGVAGANWLFGYLYKRGWLDSSTYNALIRNDDYLKEIALDQLSIGNYDFLYGAVGIAHYFLCKNPHADIVFFKRFFLQLEKLSVPVLEYFDLKTNTVLKGEVNIGFPHGIICILKLCIDSCRKGICYDAAQRVAEQVVKFLMNDTNVDTSISFFPTLISKNASTSRKSRLGWCYGDLTIAFTLAEYGYLFSANDIVRFSGEVLYHSCNRRDFVKTNIMDAGFCHGASGVAFLFLKMWIKTRDLAFKEATEFWTQKIFDFSEGNSESPRLAFLEYNSVTQEYQTPPGGILSGDSGIALMLLSYLTRDFTWDERVMLNN